MENSLRATSAAQESHSISFRRSAAVTRLNTCCCCCLVILIYYFVQCILEAYNTYYCSNTPFVDNDNMVTPVHICFPVIENKYVTFTLYINSSHFLSREPKRV
jgi:hypothetical protein